MRSRTLVRIAAAAAVTVSAVAVVSTATNAGATARGVAAAAPGDGSATDQIIVTLDSPGRRLGHANIVAAAGADARSVRAFGERAEIVKLASPQSGRALDAVMQSLAKRAGVVRVEADQIMRVTADPLADQQWDLDAPTSGVEGIDVDAAWAVTTGSSGIRVAVIDTGYLPHEDLAGRIIGGYDFISDARIGNDGDERDADASDPGDWITSQESRRGFFRGCRVSDSSWHGTHVSGTIGAATNNDIGMAGINQVSQIVPVRALGKCGGYTSDIVDGMVWAAGLPGTSAGVNPHPAQVLSLSLGGGGACSAVYQDAIDAITAAGAVVVVAAGNSDSDAGAYSPASCDSVVTVAATGKAGDRSYYSNFGNTIEIAAPGGDRIADDGDTILSTLNTGATSPAADAYVRYQGTSMATPHVSGVVSLMLSAEPGLSPGQVSQILAASARSFPSGSTCAGICGAGLLDAGAAVAQAAGTTTTTTLATTTTTSPPTGGPGDFGKISPADGQGNLKKRVTFSWGTSSGATGYEVCLDTAPNGRCDGTWQAISGTSAQANGLARGTTYEWQVRAVDATASTEADAGTFWTFTTR